MIKFLNINKQDKVIKKKIVKNITDVINKNNFILGDYVDKFEKAFANFCGSKYAISCANGTDALTIALKILNLPKNSEVIMPAMTYCSTAFAVINAGLKPVLVDISTLSPTISIDKLKAKITKNTKVIMPVHLYGSVVNIDKIKKIIKNKNIFLIDDCAQAHGAYFKKKRVGSLTDISCFSLYPGKNLGAYGDAGIITTNNKKFFDKIKNFRNLGSTIKFKHTQIGVNSRLDTIQASVLIEKLKLLDTYNKQRIIIAKFYDKNISNKKITSLNYSKGSVYHQYVIIVEDKIRLINLFKKNNIQFGFHYPKSINQIDSLKGLFRNKRFKNSENLAKKCFSIPIDPTLNKKEISKIVKVLNLF
jgi:dTDP-4-amino-4,6-dideoxygalactose transaminase